MKAKYTTLKGHQYRTFNGLRITNMEDRSVKLKLEPGDAVIEHTDRTLARQIAGKTDLTERAESID